MESINFFHDLSHPLNSWETYVPGQRGWGVGWGGAGAAGEISKGLIKLQDPTDSIFGASLKIGIFNTQDISVNRWLAVSLLPGT